MRPVRDLAIAVCVAWLAAGASWAGVIADYQGDYATGTFPTGWQYMWNAPSDWVGGASSDGSDGAIGVTIDYEPLQWSGNTGTGWTADGDTNSGNGSPARYLRLHSTGGHPGRGSAQGESLLLTVPNSVDRCAIAAYEIQPTDAGFLQISNSAVSVGSANGLDVRVYVNDTQANRIIETSASGASSFDTVLGTLNAGDTVYVAVGPNTHDGVDSFGLGYRIETAAASDLLWDADGAGPGTGGTGTWDTTDKTWDSSAGHVAWNNAANANACFGAVPGTVTVGVPVTARSLTFYTDGYTLDGSNAITLTSGGTGGAGPATVHVSDPAATAAIAAPIAGSAGLTKTGLGTLIVSNPANNYGRTKIDAGTVRLGAANVLPNNDLHNNWGGGGTLDLNGFDEAVNQLGGNFTITNIGGGTPTLTIGISNGSGWNYGGHITSDLALLKVGTGVQTLSGHSTYTGGTVVDGGTLRIDVSGSNVVSALPPGAPVTVNGGAVLFLNAGDSMGWYGGNPSVVHLDGGTMTSAAGVHQSIGAIEMTAGNLTSEGPGDGPHNYIFDGTITSHASAATSVIDAEKVLIRNGGIFDVADGDAAVDLLVSSQLTGNTDIFKNGAGTMVLSGDNGGARGVRQVNQGVLRLLHNNAMGNASMHADVHNGATLEVEGGLTGVVKTVFLQGAGVDGKGALRSLSGDNVWANGVRIGNAPNATIGVDADSLTLTQPIGYWPDADRGITKVGAGTLILRAHSTYAGGTTVDEGTLLIDVSGSNVVSALPPGAPVTVNGGAVLFLNAGDSMGWYGGNPSVVHLDGGTMTSAAGVHQSIGAIEMTAGNLTSEGPGDGPHNYIFDGTITSHASAATSVIDAEKVLIRNGGTFDVADGAAAVDLLVSTVLTGNPITKQGPGTMVIAGANTYGGETSIRDGVLMLGADNVIPDGSQVNNGWNNQGTLDLNGFSDGVHRLGGNPTVTNTGPGTPTLTIGVNNGGGWNYGGAITGSLSIVKAGTGSQQLSGNSTYTGTTAVNGGTLQLDGTHTGGGAYTVGDGATLGGIGSTASHVIVEQDGTLAPGTGTGTAVFSTGPLTLGAGALLEIGLNGLVEGSGYDRLAVTGGVSLQDAVLEVLLGFAPPPGEMFTILENDETDPIGGIFYGLPEGAEVRATNDPSHLFWITYLGGEGSNDVVLLVAPEPTTLALVGLGGLAALLRRRRRQG